MRARPLIHLPSGCIVTTIQPRVRRPAVSFVNPHKPRGKYATNDGLGITAVVLLQANRLPENEYDEVSHVCGVPRCVNPEHLVWESMSVNFSRNECQHYGQACAHEPKCIIVAQIERERIEDELTRYLLPKRRVLQDASTDRSSTRSLSLVSTHPLNGGDS